MCVYVCVGVCAYVTIQYLPVEANMPKTYKGSKSATKKEKDQHLSYLKCRVGTPAVRIKEMTSATSHFTYRGTPPNIVQQYLFKGTKYFPLFVPIVLNLSTAHPLHPLHSQIVSYSLSIIHCCTRAPNAL